MPPLFAGLTVVLAVAGLAMLYQSARSDALQTARATLAAAALRQSGQVGEWLQSNRLRLAEEAASPALLRSLQAWQLNGRRDPEAVLPALRALANGDFEQAAVYGPDGALLLATRPGAAPSSLPLEPTGPQLRLLNPQAGGDGRSSGLALVAPLRGDNRGRLAGWLHVTLSEERLARITEAAAGTPESLLVLRDGGKRLMLLARNGQETPAGRCRRCTPNC